MTLDSLREDVGSYETLTLTTAISNFLTNTTNIELKDVEGKLVATENHYEEVTGNLLVTLNKGQAILQTKNLLLSFEADVKDNATINEEIQVSTKGHVIYSDGRDSGEEFSEVFSTKIII